MSWAEEDWTVGLSGRVLQKVKELQVHQDRLSRENKQKQLQLDNIHISLEKQTGKYEEVRGELQSVHRELQSTREEAKAAVTCNGRLTQEVQTKQAQVCSLEGQLDAARTLNNKLTQEIKRLEAELEKLQNSSRLADTTLFSTPSWNTTSPWEHNASREGETSGKRDEAASRAHHGRRLHFSDDVAPSLPRQQHSSTPHRHPSNQSDTFSTPLGAFPWDREDSRPAARRRQPPTPQMPPQNVTIQGLPEQGGRGKEQTAETDISLSELRSRISSLEEELTVKARSLKSIQNEQMQSKTELAAKELSLQRARDELSAAQTRIGQDSERASAAEHRLKQLQEELKCQRQNTESSRLQHQQRVKDLEKQHQRDLTELQKERQSLEKQHQQEVNKLNQELQHARTQHNALQAQADKLLLQKQALDKDLDSLKEKLRWTEGQLKESQKKEAQTQAKLTEAVREAEGVAVSLEQSRKRERALEEEGRRLSEERADALRLLKELQEQKLVPAPPSQPAQLCSVSQSFTPQSAVSHSPRTQTKRPAATRAEHKRVEEEDVRDGGRAEVTAPYPSDREPGEGIDSEHITAFTPLNSESLKKAGHQRKSNEEENKSRSEEVTWNLSETNHPAPSAADDRVINTEESPAQQNVGCSVSEHSIPSDDLKKENAMLRSELQDIREELQKRLEDLEAQRRSETETRTRLKQLSRKQASQAVNKEEKDKEWKAQLESERAETERLKKTITALEVELKSKKEEREKKEREDDDNKEQEDRESEMIELNIQLKKQLAEVKAQLALEREERKQEEEKNCTTNNDTDVKEELSMKVAELTAEVEELQRRIKEDSQEEEKLSSAHSPLTYLSLHDEDLHSNMVCDDSKLLPSPEQHLLFCQSTNQRNMIVSQAKAEIIQEGREAIDPEHSPLSDVVQTALITTDLGASDLAKEVEHLKRKYAKETERANQYQVKLEALQSQVTRQTLQLTTAFENQSQHISGLLAELQEKEIVFLSQEEQLKQYKNELDALRNTKKEEEEMKTEKGEGKKVAISEASAQMSELQPKQAKQDPVTAHALKSVSDVDLNAQENESRPKIGTCEAETPDGDGEALQSEEHCDSAYLNKTVTTEDRRSQNEGTADVITELLALRLENQLLKQRIEDFTVSDTRTSPLQVASENHGDVVKQKQNSGDADVSFLEDERTCNGQNVVLAEEEELRLQNVKSELEGRGLEMMDSETTSAEEYLEDVSQVDHLEQQVEALQLKIISLCEDMRQQNEELAMWRLSSQPAPAFGSEEQPESWEQVPAVAQVDDRTIHLSPAQTLTVQTTLGSQRRLENFTVIREDDLLLSCSSSKLQGRMLFSRLQNDNLPEPKPLQPSRKPSTLQEFNQDTANIDQESEKENQEFVLQQSAASTTQHKVKKGAELPMKTVQQHVAKDPHKGSGTSLKDTECHAAKPQAKSSSCGETVEIDTASKSLDKDVSADMRSVSIQTEEGLRPHCVPTVCATTQTEEEEDEEELVESPPVSPVSFPKGAESDSRTLFAGSFPIPADPARLAERIRRNRTQLSAAFDDTEYEPYGLPEVVMKGFADIPTGPSCPYIVRRGLLGTTVVPASQEDSGNKEETD